jgi:hypothetical protein
LPGQSVDEQISVLQDKIVEVFLAPFLFVAVSGYGWIQWWTSRPVHPLIFTIVAIITILYARKRIWSIRATIRSLQLSRDGERLVGQMLEQLREKGYRVFHDIPGPSFNIDHAIVGPAGIFTIETKTRSELGPGSGKIFYDGGTIRIDGKQAVDQPLRQARAQARWLTALLNRDSIAKHKVRPILLFPEWYIERTGRRTKDDVWVLNPKALAKFLDCEPHTLSPSSTDSVTQILAQHCRQTLNEPARGTPRKVEGGFGVEALSGKLIAGGHHPGIPILSIEIRDFD